MPKSKKIDLDPYIREAFNENMKQTPPPPLSAAEAWEKVQKKTTKAKRFYQKTLFTAAAGLFIFIFAWSPQNGVAFDQFTDIFHTVRGSVVQIFGKVGGEEENLNVPESTEFFIIEDSEPVPERMSLAEAQEITDFLIKIPKDVPSEFQLEQVTVMKNGNEKSLEVHLHYAGEQREFTIVEMAIKGQLGFGAVVDKDDTKVEEILINGQKASLITFKNGVINLVWFTQSHYLCIEGELTKEEVIKIAMSV